MEEKMILKKYLQQEDFIVKCNHTIHLLEARLQKINAELTRRCGRNVIHGFSARIKAYDSIAAKLKRKGLAETVKAMEENLNQRKRLHQVPQKERLSEYAPDFPGSYLFPWGNPMDQSRGAAAHRRHGLLGRAGLPAPV